MAQPCRDLYQVKTAACATESLQTSPPFALRAVICPEYLLWLTLLPEENMQTPSQLSHHDMR